MFLVIYTVIVLLLVLPTINTFLVLNKFKDYLLYMFVVFLEKQQGTLRDPAHELRAKCLNVFKQAFESRKSKLVTHALSGLNVRIVYNFKIKV